ncbi:copia protein [Tanacetum coccineum]|uniref:Copia protein n=1 Tax=Tanacetum coccineum TaxID=301880 RepID=A0ABQ5H8H5_9ASTR
MIKYSFNDEEEYVAVKEEEYNDLTITSEEACQAYQEIFRIMDEGWKDLVKETSTNIGGEFTNLEILKCWCLETLRRLFNTRTLCNKTQQWKSTEQNIRGGLIMEYLVNISKRRAFWSLNKDNLKITILTTNTSYPSRKTRRIRACSHKRPRRKQTQYAVHIKLEMEMEIPCSSRVKFITACSYSTNTYVEIMKVQVKVSMLPQTLISTFSSAVLEKDSKASKIMKEKYKSLALKSRKVSSDEEDSCSGSDEDYPMAVRDFKKFFRRRGKFVHQPYDDKKNIQKVKEEKKGKEERSEGEGDSKKYEIYLMALDNNEVRLKVKLEPDEWIKDSGCSRHMTGNKDLFSTYKAINGDGNGVVSRNKARLVAQGYNQQEGIDFDDTYAPVARLESIRILLTYACAHDFKLFQMDVKSAFLNGFIDKEVYVS